MSLPLVSVVIPTYNRVELVQQAIDSVLAQSYPQLEVIVVDDGSSDGTGAMLNAQYGQQIHYLWQANQGESVARNRGIAVANGEYIAFLDSDDQWLPTKIERQVEAMECAKDISVIGCQAYLIDVEGKPIKNASLFTDLPETGVSLERSLLVNTFGGGSIALMRSHLLRQLGGFDPTIRFGEDWDLWLRVLINGGKLEVLPEPLARVRRHRHTQCHLPSPENTERVLYDHLRLLQKAFDSLAPLSDTLQCLRARSLGRQYLEASFAGFAWQKPIEALQWLQHAYQQDPGIWRNARYLTDMLVNYGSAIAEIEGDFTPWRIDGFIHTMFDALDAHQHLSGSIRRKARARLYADAGFRLFQAQEMERARKYMAIALSQDIGLWLDLGLWRRWWSTWR